SCTSRRVCCRGTPWVGEPIAVSRTANKSEDSPRMDANVGDSHGLTLIETHDAHINWNMSTINRVQETTSMTLPELQEQTTQHFQRRYREKPPWVVAAPGRVNIIGEHTDYN